MNRLDKQFDLTQRVTEKSIWSLVSFLLDDVAGLPTHFVEAFRIAIRNRDVNELLQLCDACLVTVVSEYVLLENYERKALYLLGSIIKKYPFKTDEDARRTCALDTFRQYESQCHEFNSKPVLTRTFDVRKQEIFSLAKSFIVALIGEHGNAEELMKGARHGPGLTFGLKDATRTTPYFKNTEWPYTVTKGCEAYARYCIETDDRWIGALQDSYRERFGIPKHLPIDSLKFWEEVLEIVEGNRITFVPKDAKTLRTIAIEPTMNVYLQLGVDGVFRKALKRWGINLDDQTTNQKLAQKGSIDQSLATLDLKGASDTVTLSICKQLLPEWWYDYLLRLRSPCGLLDGEQITYAKISSMGNGFTFALESLIFSALAYAVYKVNNLQWRDGTCSIYGDDIVVRTEVAEELIDVLHDYGFVINWKKSYLTGFFRESCGGDFYQGTDISSIKIRSELVNVFDVMSLHNLLFKWFVGCDNTFEDNKSLKYVRSLVPPSLHLYGPMYEHTDGYFFVKTIPPKGGVISFDCYVQEAVVSQKQNNFLFRKLLARLPDNDSYTMKDTHSLKTLPTSSVFDVVRRGVVKVKVQRREIPYWILLNHLSTLIY